MFSDLLRYTISQHMEVNPSEKVIEAGERCAHGNECDKCPYYELGRPDCMLELINGQKAAINSLNFDVETYRLRWAKATAKLDDAETEIDRLEAEIEKLKEDNEALNSAVSSALDIVNSNYQNGRTDGIKEFWERLKHIIKTHDLICGVDCVIDDIAKEVLGADNAE